MRLYEDTQKLLNEFEIRFQSTQRSPTLETPTYSMSPLLKAGSVTLLLNDSGAARRHEERRRRQAESIAGWHPDRVNMNAFQLLVSLGTPTELLARESDLLAVEQGCHRVFQDEEFSAVSTAFLNLLKMPLREGKSSFSSSNPNRSGSLWPSYKKTMFKW